MTDETDETPEVIPFIPFDMVVPRKFNPAHSQAYAERLAKEIEWFASHDVTPLFNLGHTVTRGEHEVGVEVAGGEVWTFARFLKIRKEDLERSDADPIAVMRHLIEVASRGASHGETNAVYDYAYGTDEVCEQQAARLAQDYYPREVQAEERRTYIAAFEHAYTNSIDHLEED